MEHETQKLKSLDENHNLHMKEWRDRLRPRKKVISPAQVSLQSAWLEGVVSVATAYLWIPLLCVFLFFAWRLWRMSWTWRSMSRRCSSKWVRRQMVKPLDPPTNLPNLSHSALLGAHNIWIWADKLASQLAVDVTSLAIDKQSETFGIFLPTLQCFLRTKSSCPACSVWDQYDLLPLVFLWERLDGFRASVVFPGAKLVDLNSCSKAVCQETVPKSIFMLSTELFIF